MSASTQAIIVKGACPHDCPDACALETTVVDGKAIAVHGARGHATTHGVLCTKVTHALDRTYHPDRVLHPLKRVGTKGSAQFERITWDEALATIAQRWKAVIAQHGAEAILPYSYAGNMGLLNFQSLGHRLFYALGASQLERGICSSAGAAGMAATLGASVGTRMEQLENAELIILWGTNPITSSVHSWSYIQRAKKKGATLIAIDCYKSLSAQKCDQFIPIKQGTDAALALALMHCLARDNLLDEDYLSRYALGWDALRTRLLDWPPSRAAAITGIPVATIEQLAKRYGATRKAIIRANYGLNRHAGGGMAVRTIACLPALTGAWREPAGGFLLSSSGHYPLDKAYLERPDLMPTPTPRVVNMSQLGDALTTLNDPPVMAMYVYNSNPAVVAPDSNAVLRGMAREDLFTVVHDSFITDTARYADIVLPATTHFENFDIHRSYGHTTVLINHPAIAPVGESRANNDVFRALAKAMEMREPALHESDESIARNALKWTDPAMHGVTYDAIASEGWAQMNIADAPFAQGNFPTPSGKVELYCERLIAQGLDPLPTYIPPAEPALHGKRFPLALNTPPYRHFMNSTFANVARYRKDRPAPTLEIHPDDAKARGIAHGDRLRIFNDRGSVMLSAEVTDHAHAGCVTTQSIWWTQDTPDLQGINVLTSQALTDMGGGATFYDCQVEVERLLPDTPRLQ
jgi:anaerobic selenocysteine-containing dehydrogenase